MNAKKRVMAAFQHQPTDKVPVYHLGFSSEVASALLGREAFVGGGIQQWREAVSWWQSEDAHREFVERSFQDAIDIALFCDHDIVRPTYWRYKPRPTRRVDEYTFMYEYGTEEHWTVLRFDPPSEQCNIYSYLPESALTFADLERQLKEQEASLVDYQPTEETFGTEFEARRKLNDEYVIRMSAARLGIGMASIWLEATMLRPDLVEKKLEIEAEICERNIRFLAKNDFHIIFGGDDFASNDAPVYSPRAFHRFMLPALKRVADVCQECDSFFCFASDGNLWPVADDLFGRSGVDAYYEIDRRAGMDLSTLINSTDVAMLTPEEVAAQTRECLDFARLTPGIIAGVSNYFVPGTPIENVMAVLDTIALYR